MRSAEDTSSRVELNAFTKPRGKSLIKPTVSEKITSPNLSRVFILRVGSSVENNMSLANTFDEVKLLKIVDFPALVYPTSDTKGVPDFFLLFLPCDL